MVVTLLEDKNIIHFKLPEKRKGTYWIQDWKTNDRLLSVERKHGKWIAKSTVNMWFLGNENEYMENVLLRPFNLYSVQSAETERFNHIMVEPKSDYERYAICSTKDIHIGRNADNEICLNSVMISSVHARLSWREDGWLLFDEGSTNGVYVNNIRVTGYCPLQPGDRIYMMGFSLIIGKGLIAVNNPNQLVSVQSNCLRPYTVKQLPSIKEKMIIVPEYYVPDKQVALKDNYHCVEQCKDIIENGRLELWERKWKQEGLLKFYLNKTCMIDIMKYSLIGVKGSLRDIIAFCKGVLLQLITNYSYADVKIIFLLDRNAEKEFNRVRWLPHMWDNERRQSYYVKNMQDVDKLVMHLKNTHNGLTKNRQSDDIYYIVFGFDRELEARFDVLNLQNRLNISMLSFAYDSQKEFSKYNMLLDMNSSIHGIKCVREENEQMIDPDIYVRENIDMLYLQLANTYMDLGKRYHNLIKSVMVELYIPIFGKTYDISIPRDVRIGEWIPFIKRQIAEVSEDSGLSQGKGILCDREDGIVLDVEQTSEESGILNGTRLMLI